MEVDMRSEDAKSLAAVDAKVQRVLRDALAAENARWTGPRDASAQLSLKIDTIGIRPTGAQADTAPIVQTALAAGEGARLHVVDAARRARMRTFRSASAFPAIRIGGGGNGEGAHSLGEWYADGPNGYLGPQWAALLVAALAGVAASRCRE